VSSQIGIRTLLRQNRDFRYLWVAQLVSFLGDWVNTLAVYDLVTELSGGSGHALAWVLIARFIPTLAFSAAAGVLADRLPRRRILITADIARVFVVLGFLIVRDSDQLWLVYALTAAQLSLSAFYQPARDAALPTITSRAELLAANALSGASWSAMLALGAALGGLITATIGREAAFVIDAVTYLFSALMLLQVRIPNRPRRSPAPATISLRSLTGVDDVAEGAAFVYRHPMVAWLLTLKFGWGLGGGVLLLLVIFGETIFPPGGPAGVGILYAARGLGSALGPFIARRLAGESPRGMRIAIIVAFLLAGIFYIEFSAAPGLRSAVLALILAHMGGSTLWVFSTTLLQMAVPDRFRGRVFAAEWALVTLTMAVSSYFTGRAIDAPGADPRAVARVLGAVFLVPGIAWAVGQLFFAASLDRHIAAREAEETEETG
jgi:predicted MFS family arabinose efflux permease